MPYSQGEAALDGLTSLCDGQQSYGLSAALMTAHDGLVGKWDSLARANTERADRQKACCRMAGERSQRRASLLIGF